MKEIFAKRGTCILTDEPFVAILRAKYRTERCDHCFQSAKLQKCGGCHYVHYCGADCQKEAWPDHKPECANLKELIKVDVPDAARVIAKIVNKLKSGGDMQRGYYSKHGFRKFRDLMSHYHEIKKDETRMEHVEALSVVLMRLLPHGSMPNENELLGIYGRLVTNGFNILDPEMNSIATGIFLAVSIVDHSCTPNAVATFEGRKLSLRLLEDIPGFQWSKVFISYIDLINTRDDRRQQLKNQYYFLCTCSRCVNTDEQQLMEAACCPNRKCEEPLIICNNSPDNECKKCRETVTNEFINKFDQTVTFTKEKLDEMKAISFLDVLELCLRRQEGVLHQLNIWHVKTLDNAFESAIQMEIWEKALEFGLRMLPGFRRYNGETHPLLGINLMKIGKIELLLNMPVSALQHLKEAAAIIKVTHGEGHSLYRQQLVPLLHQAYSCST